MELKTYQQALLDKLNQGGFKRIEMSLFSAGRQTGKSQINQYINQWHSMQESRQPKYKIITSAEVDGKPWHTVQCSSEVAEWIRKNHTDWMQHIDSNWTMYKNIFDMPEELYMMIVLKFGK